MIKLLLILLLSILPTLADISEYPTKRISEDYSVSSNINELVIEFVDQIVNNLKSTKYQHEGQVFDIEKGEILSNCSGFANFVLLSLYQEAYYTLETEETWCWKSNPQPRAAAYYKAFIDSESSSNNANQYWQRIKSIMDSKPGDFLAWQEDSFDGNSNSGHVLIIAGLPRLLEDGTVAIEVIDASRHPHSNDTRKAFTGGGLGKETMRFKINESGEPTGTHWTLKSSKTKLRKTAIGRLK